MRFTIEAISVRLRGKAGRQNPASGFATWPNRGSLPCRSRHLLALPSRACCLRQTTITIITYLPPSSRSAHWLLEYATRHAYSNCHYRCRISTAGHEIPERELDIWQQEAAFDRGVHGARWANDVPPESRKTPIWQSSVPASPA